MPRLGGLKRGCYHAGTTGATRRLTRRVRRTILCCPTIRRLRRPRGEIQIGSAVQVLELLILAALAAVVLYQLYAVLGRRVGRQPEDGLAPPMGRVAGAQPVAPEADPAPAPAGVAAIRARDASFDLTRFLDGARIAYESIVKAFAAGDRETLRRLVSAEVFERFEPVMAAREAENRSETIEFLHPARTDLDLAEVEGDIARAKVRFLAELRSRTKGPEGEGVDDRRTAEIWTFERRFTSLDPNWTLVRVDAAES